MLRTRLSELLGIEVPLLVGPMESEMQSLDILLFKLI